MAELYIATTEIKTRMLGEPLVNHGDGECRVHAFVSDGRLTMSVAATHNNKDEIADFYLDGAADIDALRRYCEMALEQFAIGMLVEID